MKKFKESLLSEITVKSLPSTILTIRETATSSALSVAMEVAKAEPVSFSKIMATLFVIMMAGLT